MADEVKKPDLAVTSEPQPVKEVTVQASPEQTTVCECLYWLGLYYALCNCWELCVDCCVCCANGCST
uniref:Uncharacterized protein n=1 Tax=Daphnia magna TaxID=35525 RepID=A0A0P6DEB8_9CRUS